MEAEIERLALTILLLGSSRPVEEELPTSGVLTSPDYPERYDNDMDVVQWIEVPEGNTIWMQFSHFDLELPYDTVTISDQDGSLLGHFYDDDRDGDDRIDYGDWTTKKMVSKTNKVKVRFVTDPTGNDFKGWRLTWGKY